ncbi:MAG: hypothetical protein C4583_13965 [Anaerolineaceae bacterium]|nr:MAG: hypothetical protein C4583_13965 [Anaerolineaceae bacterium]
MWSEWQFGYNECVKRLFLIFFVLCLLLTMGTPAFAQSTGSEYFDDTKHFVSGDFLTYYRSVSNATQLFGYPITEAFTKNGMLVQYFQRARFELHPDQPAGQRVKLTPIGSEMYVPGGERLEIFNPFACRYFAQTGLSVCYAFLDFFKANGGVERFGNPISTFEYHNNLIVQYFENARFEWKPWMPDGQRVSVAELGLPYFYSQQEEPNLLKPVDPNHSGNLIQLQVRAFVWKAVTLASDQQLVYVIVQDQTLQPVTGAQGTATVRWADGTNSVLTFSTNSSGVGIVPLTFVNQPYGKMVNIEILVTKDGLEAKTTTSFRIWY